MLRSGNGRGRRGMKRGTVTPSQPSYGAEATAFFARLTTQPNSTLKGHMDTLIKALVSAGSWAKIDRFILPGVAVGDSMKYWNVNAAATLVGTLTYNPTGASAGWSGFSTSNYINTGFDPATAGGLFTQNSHHMGVYVTAIGAAVTDFVIGTHQTAIGFGVSNTFLSRSASSGGSVAADGPPQAGHWGVSRISGTQYQRYQLGSPTGLQGIASEALVTANILIGARNDGAGAPTSPTNKTVAGGHFGSTLNDAEMLATRNAIATYMAAIASL